MFNRPKILFRNFLLKFSNKSPRRIKPGRTLWCPEFKRLLWSPTPLSSCISVHLKETWNSPDLFVCFSFGQPSNRGTIMTPAVSSFHSAKAGRCDRCRESSSQAHRRRGGLRGREPAPGAAGEPGPWNLPQVAPGSDWLRQLCLLALLPVVWWVCKWG